MKLRDLIKSNGPNDGSRTLLESILVPEVAMAFKDWERATGGLRCVLIGGLALSYYAKPRATTDVDLLFISPKDVPGRVEGFKRNRKGAFIHKKTHVEVEVIVPSAINVSEELVQAIMKTAIPQGEILVASPSGLVAIKLGRFKLRDQADIEALYESGAEIDLTPFPIPQEWIDRYETLIAGLE